MKQVKIFTSGKEEVVTKNINEFIKDKNVIDIKFNTTECSYDVLVIYEVGHETR